MAMYKLKPAMKSAIWGGRKLIDAFHMDFDGENLAEAWMLSAHPDGESRVDSGDCSGLTLSQIISKKGKSILGKNVARFAEFPILIKLIDANDNLSVQVHPDNEYALAHEHQYGKTEMWYVIEAEPSAKLCMGCKEDISSDDFNKHAADGRLDEVLNFVPVQKGDVFFIPSGTIHAIGAGIFIAEIQQNSNVTYRVYDYDRIGADGKKRELHLDKALEVASLTPPKTDFDFGSHIGKCDCFETDLLEVSDDSVSISVDDSSFVCLLVVDGNGKFANGPDTYLADKGDCFFIEADSGPVDLSGDMTVIKVCVPEFA